MTRPSTAFRNVAALIAPGQQWKRRLLNAFALVALPAGAAAKTAPARLASGPPLPLGEVQISDLG